MRTHLAEYLGSCVGSALGVLGEVLVAIADRLIGNPPEAERHIDTWGRD